MPIPILVQRADLRLAVAGGTAARVLDFAAPWAGHIGVHEITGRLLVGHTYALAGDDEPVIVTSILEPASAIVADAKCTGCEARSHLGQLDGDTLLLAEHHAGCTQMEALLAKAGAR